MSKGRQQLRRLGGTATVVLGVYQSAFGAAYANFMARLDPPEADPQIIVRRTRSALDRWEKEAREYARLVAEGAAQAFLAMLPESKPKLPSWYDIAKQIEALALTPSRFQPRRD